MHINANHHSVSLASVEFQPFENGTKLIYNEQVAFLDDTNANEGTKSRRYGTAAHLDRLVKLIDKNQ